MTSWLRDDDSDNRSFGEIRESVYQKFGDADVVEEGEDSVFVNVTLDEKEAAVFRMDLLHPATEIGESANADDAAQFAIHSRAKSIFDTVDRIEEEAQKHIDEEKDKINFAELEPKEKQKRGERLSKAKQNIRDLLVSTELFDDVIVFYMLVGSLMERYTGELLLQELIAEEFEESEEATTWVENMSQAHREKVLKLTGILSADFVSEMGEVRETRNKLAHEIEHQQQLVLLDDIAGEVGHAVNVLNTVHRELTGVGLIGLEE